MPLLSISHCLISIGSVSSYASSCRYDNLSPSDSDLNATEFGVELIPQPLPLKDFAEILPSEVLAKKKAAVKTLQKVANKDKSSTLSSFLMMVFAAIA